MLRFLVGGIFQGAVYGFLAVGLVLVYKGTRAFNFAQGEFGTVAAFMMFLFLGTFPYWSAFVLALLVAVLMGLVVERVVVRPLMASPRVTLLVATTGVALASIDLQLIIGGPEGRVLPRIVEGNVTILGATLEKQQLFVLLALAILALVLAMFFARTNLGIAILAVSEDPTATRLVGVSVPLVSAFIWGLAAFVGAVAGLLQVPVGGTGLIPGVMTTKYLIPAFTAAVIGGMTSLQGGFVGGLIVGVAQSLATFFLQGKVPGEQVLVVFALLLTVLLVRPQGLLGAKEA